MVLLKSTCLVGIGKTNSAGNGKSSTAIPKINTQFPGRCFAVVSSTKGNSDSLARLFEIKNKFRLNRNICPELLLTGFSRIAYLNTDGKSPGHCGDGKCSRKQSKRIIDRLIEKPRYTTMLSTFIGTLCSTIGIAIDLNSRTAWGARSPVALVDADIGRMAARQPRLKQSAMRTRRRPEKHLLVP